MTNLWKLRVLIAAFALTLLSLGFYLGERQGLLVALLITLAWAGLILLYGRQQWIDFFQARPLEGNDPWGLVSLTVELSQKAKVPVPRLYSTRFAFPVAVVVGRSPQSSVLVISEDLVRSLEPAELRAILCVQIARLRLDDLRWMGILGGFLAPLEALLTIADRLVEILTRKPFTWFRRQLRPFVQLSLRLVRGKDWMHGLDKLAVQITRDEENFIRALRKLESHAQKRRPYLPESISPFMSVDPLTAQCGSRYLRAQPSVRDRLMSLKTPMVAP